VLHHYPSSRLAAPPLADTVSSVRVAFREVGVEPCWPFTLPPGAAGI
jgi:hypothetical protein